MAKILDALVLGAVFACATLGTAVIFNVKWTGSAWSWLVLALVWAAWTAVFYFARTPGKGEHL